MSAEKKKRLMESLVFAAALGIVAVLLCSAGLLVDVRRSAFEREVLSGLAQRPIASAYTKTSDPCFSRIYRVGGKGDPLWGVVISLRERHGAAMAAALFTPNGELQVLRIIGASDLRQEYLDDAWPSSFLGKGGSSPYPISKDAALASDTFVRASEAIRLEAKVSHE